MKLTIEAKRVYLNGVEHYRLRLGSPDARRITNPPRHLGHQYCIPRADGSREEQSLSELKQPHGENSRLR
jgi:hypothetical protein